LKRKLKVFTAEKFHNSVNSCKTFREIEHVVQKYSRGYMCCSVQRTFNLLFIPHVTTV